MKIIMDADNIIGIILGLIVNWCFTITIKLFFCPGDERNHHF